jgi:hypothetical protein
MAAGTVLEFMPDPPPTGAPAPDGAAELARVPEPLGALGSACGAPAWQPDARNSSVTARTQTDPLRVLVPLS